MHVWNALYAARWKYRTQKSPFWHHRTTLLGCIFTAEACIDNRKKNLLNTDTSSTCPHNMVNLRATNGWDLLASLGHPFQFQQLSRLGTVTARHSSSGHQPNFAALNRRRHLYLAGRPSRWALAHILVVIILPWHMSYVLGCLSWNCICTVIVRDLSDGCRDHVMTTTTFLLVTFFQVNFG